MEKTAAEVLVDNSYVENGVVKVSGGEEEVNLSEEILSKFKQIVLNRVNNLKGSKMIQKKMVFENNGEVYGIANDEFRTLIANNLGKKNKEEIFNEFMSLVGLESVHNLVDELMLVAATDVKQELIKH